MGKYRSPVRGGDEYDGKAYYPPLAVFNKLGDAPEGKKGKGRVRDDAGGSSTDTGGYSDLCQDDEDDERRATRRSRRRMMKTPSAAAMTT